MGNFWPKKIVQVGVEEGKDWVNGDEEEEKEEKEEKEKL